MSAVKGNAVSPICEAAQKLVGCSSTMCKNGLTAAKKTLGLEPSDQHRLICSTVIIVAGCTAAYMLVSCRKHCCKKH